MNKIEELKERLKDQIIEGIGINRIPPKTKSQFIQFSEEEFCSDRGMALKFLMDFYLGLIPTGIEHLELEIENIKQELSELKSKPLEEKKITSADGKRILKR